MPCPFPPGKKISSGYFPSYTEHLLADFLYLFSKGILLCPKPGCIKILEDMSKLNFSPDELLI